MPFPITCIYYTVYIFMRHYCGRLILEVGWIAYTLPGLHIIETPTQWHVGKKRFSVMFRLIYGLLLAQPWI